MTDLRFYDPDADDSSAVEDPVAEDPAAVDRAAGEHESHERDACDAEAETAVEAALPEGLAPPDRAASVDVPVDEFDAEDDELDGDDNSTPGGLLAELERRQNEVLLELDRLNDQVEDVLRSLGVRLDGDPEEAEVDAAVASDSQVA